MTEAGEARRRSLPRRAIGKAATKMLARKSASPRLKIFIACLIACTSALGAIAAWRASVAADAATELERQGFAQGVAREQERAGVLSKIDAARFLFLRATEYETQAAALRNQAAKLKGADRKRLLAQASAFENLAAQNRSSVDPDALNANGQLALSRKFRLEWENVKASQDIDPRREFSLADEMKVRVEDLVGLTALLIAAALFFALAEVSRSRAYLIYFIGGTTVFVVSSTLLFSVGLV